MKLDLRFLSSLSLVAALGFGTGCPAEDDPADTGADTDEPTSGTPTTDATDPTDSTNPTDPTDSTDPTDPTDTTDGTTSGGETTDGPTDTTEPTGADPLPDGSDCTMNEQCESGACYVTGIGGSCGQCSGDEDCAEGGCSLPNPLSTPPEGSVCNMGELGGGCESSDVCADGLTCVEIINVPGILLANTCSECETTADCDGDELCNVSVDVANISGQQTCVPPMSVPDGEFCDLEGDGNDACENFCAEADLMSLVTFGLCGECRIVDGTEEGCADGQTCVEPVVGIDGTVEASFCE